MSTAGYCRAWGSQRSIAWLLLEKRDKRDINMSLVFLISMIGAGATQWTKKLISKYAGNAAILVLKGNGEEFERVPHISFLACTASLGVLSDYLSL